jgi:hypothetical protein
MLRRPAISLFLVCAAVTISLLPLDAAAGPPGDGLPAVKVAKKPKGPYVGGVGQVGIAKLNLGPGKVRNGYLKIRSTVSHNQFTTLQQLGFPKGLPGYKFRWFRGKKEITSKVQGLGSKFTLKPGKTKLFRLRIKAKSMPTEVCVGGQFHVMPEDFYNAGYFQVNSTSACD